MPSKTRTIGVFAREVGVSVETIRYYERRGLIEQPPKTPGRYRDYSDDALAQMQYIKLAQAFGFSLTEIEKLTGQLKEKVTFCKAVENTVADKLMVIDKQLESLLALKAELVAFKSRCALRSSEDCPLFDELSKLGISTIKSSVQARKGT